MDEDTLLVAELARESQRFLQSRIDRRNGGSLNENRINWKGLGLPNQNVGQQPAYPQQHQQNYNQPILEGGDIPQVRRFIPMPMVNGQPIQPEGVMPPPIQPQQQSSPFIPFPQNPITEKIGNFELPSFSKDSTISPDSYDKLMTEIKLIKKDIKKILKLLTESAKVKEEEPKQLTPEKPESDSIN